MRALRRTVGLYRQRMLCLRISRCQRSKTHKDQKLVSNVFRALMGDFFILHDHSHALGEKILRFVPHCCVVLLTRDFVHALLDDRRKDFLDSGFADSERQNEQQANDRTDDRGQLPTKKDT